MSLRLNVIRAAQADVLRASKWYESEETGLGERFLTSIDGHLDQIVAAPLLQPAFGSAGIRRRLLSP